MSRIQPYKTTSTCFKTVISTFPQQIGHDAAVEAYITGLLSPLDLWAGLNLPTRNHWAYVFQLTNYPRRAAKKLMTANETEAKSTQNITQTHQGILQISSIIHTTHWQTTIGQIWVTAYILEQHLSWKFRIQFSIINCSGQNLVSYLSFVDNKMLL